MGSLFKAATHPKRPHIVAGIFLLKTRHGYIDQPQPKPEESSVKVELVLLRALTACTDAIRALNPIDSGQ